MWKQRYVSYGKLHFVRVVQDDISTPKRKEDFMAVNVSIFFASFIRCLITHKI
jgi:hypothetical protein